MSHIDQTKRVLTLWHESYSKLSATEQFRLFVLASTQAAVAVTRDRWGNFQKYEDNLVFIGDDDDDKPAVDVAPKIVPKLSNKKLQRIGKAVLEGCHKSTTSFETKATILEVLVGQVTDATASKCVRCW